MSKTSLSELQRQFMAHLTRGHEAIADHIEEQGDVSVDTRLHIYRNAYRARLRETLDTDHEILGVYLGDELYGQMVEGYIRACPSSHISLRQYADDLPAYLNATVPFCDHPLIGDLAKFERLLLAAFDAADAPRLTRQQLIAIPAAQWPQMQFTFHPSVQLFVTQWNTVEVWQALKAQQAPEPATRQASAWLLWRNQERLTEFRSIAAEERQLLELALHGTDFAALCDLLLEQHGGEDISTLAVGYLLNWVQQGLLTRAPTGPGHRTQDADRSYSRPSSAI